LTAFEANVVYTILTDSAGVAEASVSARTVTADSAFGTKLVGRTVGALLSAFLTDVGTVGTAPAASYAYIIYTVFTDRTAIAEIIISAHAVTAGSAFGAQLVESAV